VSNAKVGELGTSCIQEKQLPSSTMKKYKADYHLPLYISKSKMLMVSRPDKAMSIH